MRYGVLTSFGAYRLRCPLPQPEPDQALLAKLRRLPQVHHRQGRGLCSLPPGAHMYSNELEVGVLMHVVYVGLQVPVPQRLDIAMGRPAW